MGYHSISNITFLLKDWLPEGSELPGIGDFKVISDFPEESNSSLNLCPIKMNSSTLKRWCRVQSVNGDKVFVVAEFKGVDGVTEIVTGSIVSRPVEPKDLYMQFLKLKSEKERWNFIIVNKIDIKLSKTDSYGKMGEFIFQLSHSIGIKVAPLLKALKLKFELI